MLILVGGTICTGVNEDGILSVREDADSRILENFLNSDSPYRDKVQFDVSENLFILSENLTLDDWNRMIDTYRRYTKGNDYDGVLIAHGTYHSGTACMGAKREEKAISYLINKCEECGVDAYFSPAKKQVKSMKQYIT